MFKDVQKTLPVQSKAVKETLLKCLTLCQNFQTSLKIYNKFDAVWQALASEQGLPAVARGEASRERKKSLWLLYLVCKHQVFERGMKDVGEWAAQEQAAAAGGEGAAQRDYLII